MAIGYTDIAARWAAWQRIQSFGYHAPALIHPHAYVAEPVRVGEGAMVTAGAIVDVRAKIGDLTVLRPSTRINHDSKIGPNAFVSPSATVCGFVDIGPHSFAGAGAVIVDHCQVPEMSSIKMVTGYTGRPS
jgi:UDP-3-O-[3-hydroxymyristoyl] glucosamine N-acyltransferase